MDLPLIVTRVHGVEVSRRPTTRMLSSLTVVSRLCRPHSMNC